MDVIAVKDLRKSYGGNPAVDGISFSVPEGSFFALLGPNGAGKSTTISILCSIIPCDSGSAEIFGRDAMDPSARRDIGVVFQDPMMDKQLTVRENIALRGGMYGLSGGALDEAVGKAMRSAGIEDLAGRKYGTLSGGQRRRADIARSLVHGPRLLVLDEPTSGLDPSSRRHIWDTVSRLNREEGLTVLLTTHYLEEAAGADDVVIMDHGRIAAHGTPAEIRERHSQDRMEIMASDPGAVRSHLDSIGADYSESNSSFEVFLARTLDAIPILEALQGQISAFEVRMGTLDDAFLRITGGDAE
ncbi:MAG: ABC transporter ATP-binding protein [Candidatus Methanomethylophilaceae archaeon]|jgi:multidrug/hemolysin transport system ATP-binding protein|nr:ABC transporter ATP-binding protein [Candidatus Methanomethylophilaceae archaeon]